MWKLLPSRKEIVAALRSPIPWVALVIPLVASIAGSQALWRDATRDASRQFERRTETAEAALRARIRAHEQVLMAGAALWSATRDVSRTQWGEFVARLKLAERTPGIQAMGIAERVRRADRDKHVKRVRAEGLPDYDIRPPGERDDYVVIVYNEPYKGRNARVVGLDTYSQPVLRAAIDRAFELGEAAITEKVVLPGEDAAGVERAQPGFVMYVPVFRPGLPVGTKEERDAALLGFVFGTFRTLELVAGVLDRGVAQSVDMALYDGAQAAPEALLVDLRESDKSGARSSTPVFQRAAAVEVGGRRWTMLFASRPEFEARAEDNISLGLLGAGLLASAAMFALALLLVAARMHLFEISMRDALTQLFNRRYLEETMGHTVARARRAKQSIGIVLLDIDGFKSFDDNFGGGCGDFVLTEFARLMEKNVRKGDIMCRYGGAEFAIAMPGASVENARTRAERLREVLEVSTLQFGGKALGKITLSAGVASYPEHGEEFGSVVQRAHRALYAAKNAGRNQVAIAEVAPAGA